MISINRDSGIDVIGDVQWGTHFYLFYKTKEDLEDALIPYFEAGLKNNEFCMCITSDQLNANDMKKQMSKAIRDFEKYLSSGQIEILPYNEWYEIDGIFDPKRVLDGWVEKLQKALKKGYSGLRLSGNTFWLEKAIWKDFLDYEQVINNVIGMYNMIALCTYSMEQCGIDEILDVVSAHQFAMIKRDGKWKIIENAGLKETKKALQDTKSHLTKAQELARIGSWSWDIKTDHGCGSDEVYRIMGIPPGESLNYEYIIHSIHPADRKMVEKAIDAALKGEKPYSVDCRIVQKEGAVRFVHICADVSRNSMGDPTRMICVVQDITELKEAEKELKEAKERAELYLDLMSHDINNLNQIALGYLELAGQRITDDDVRELVARPIDAINHSSNLIDNVKKLQKARSGVLKTEAIDLDRLLAGLRSEYMNVPGKDITISYKQNPDSIIIANGLVKDIFANLIWNAIKHNPSAQVRIGLGLTQVVENKKKYYKVIVEDNGPGIPDAQKKKIFVRFSKDNANASGKGLGLYLAKTLVEGFHGKIWVEDREPGQQAKGSRFVVMLPVFNKA